MRNFPFTRNSKLKDKVWEKKAKKILTGRIKKWLSWVDKKMLFFGLLSTESFWSLYGKENKARMIEGRK